MNIMSQTDITDKLTANIKALYPLAQAADEQLETLTKEKKGQFASVFKEESPFKAKANRFLPYMEEVAYELLELPAREPSEFKAELHVILNKMSLLNNVLNAFHNIQDAPVEKN